MSFGDITSIINDIGYEITIERATESGDDDYSGKSVSWSEHVKVQGVIQTARSAFNGRQQIAESLRTKSTHVMYCMNADITDEDRVLYRGIYYKIQFPDEPDLQQQFLTIYLDKDSTYGSESSQ